MVLSAKAAVSCVCLAASLLITGDTRGHITLFPPPALPLAARQGGTAGQDDGGPAAPPASVGAFAVVRR
eukprot:CAMPEP_0172641016 /NCGR_PEP_ID=MMETSP1068-20121228/225345_1 /TAXON_ID=35684 /ORGANISM="Pseudopedinella elastica, Strain CCMP716" /LENGTH=68 /DNA_ID=CAMNT_0013454503 /DNA_START=1 /DNA_END=204 /DNA_ORIENTATION=+